MYGGRKALRQLPRPVADRMKAVSRQMLHAWRLEICHPRSGADMHLEAPVAGDMQHLLESLEALREDAV